MLDRLFRSVTKLNCYKHATQRFTPSMEQLENRSTIDASLLFESSFGPAIQPSEHPTATTKFIDAFTTLLAESESNQTTAPDYVAFAKALALAGVKFYGAGWCPHCTVQKQTF